MKTNMYDKLTRRTKLRYESTIDCIFKSVYAVTAHTRDTILGNLRRRDIVDARRITSILILKYCQKLTYAEVGFFIGRDHCTIIHNLATHANLLESDEAYREKYKNIVGYFEMTREIEQHQDEITGLRDHILGLIREYKRMRDARLEEKENVLT